MASDILLKFCHNMSKSRFGGFTTRKQLAAWNEVRSLQNALLESQPEKFDYSTSKGIWGITATQQFPKYNSTSAASLISTTTGTTQTIVIPTTSAVGDVAVLIDRSTTVSGLFPSGWTQIVRTNTTGIDCVCSYKVITESDISASISGLSGAANKVLFVFRPDLPVKTVVAAGINGEATTVAPGTQFLKLASVSAPVIGFAHYASTGAIATRGSGDLATSEVSVATTQYVRYIIFDRTNTPINGLISMSDGGTNVLQSFYIELN